MAAATAVGPAICANAGYYSLLAALAAKLLIVPLLDCSDRRLEIICVHAHHDEDAEVAGFHVGIGEQALQKMRVQVRARHARTREPRGSTGSLAHRTGKDLLDVGLVRDVRGDLLEDDLVEREVVAELPVHLEVVEHPVGRHEGLQRLG